MSLPVPLEKIQEIVSKWEKNPMLKPKIAKVVVNIGLGSATERLSAATKILEELTGSKPVPRKAKKTIREFGIRRGQNIGVIVTLRGAKAQDFLRKALHAIGYRIRASSFDEFGNVCFGIKEHIMLPGVRYDPEIGIFGMDVCLTIERPGYRVARRRRARSSIPRRHRVTPYESMILLNKEFNVEIVR